ncbi:uncharacterized protein LTR77_005670 [Saxophila tyrrhenica]|uniref:DAGKc domain-containing protein n=1 Tax=Saxophila tyrrhenica TaxID=1690608 RepID=A0AAV9P9Q8_9PEZI|nr:hypothetical protein LTR77_005670 [Saxophila tyrrhenica]
MSSQGDMDAASISGSEGEGWLTVVDEKGTKVSVAYERVIAILSDKASSANTESSIRTVLCVKPDKDGLEALTSGALDQLKVSLQPTEQCHWYRDGAVEGVERHVVVSTGSGTGTASTVWQNLVQPLLARLSVRENEHYHLNFTTSGGSVAEFARMVLLPKANQGVALAVLLLSGDGGIVDIVNSLLSEDRSAAYENPTMSLLPLGTGNALAHSSGITGDATLGLRAMLQGTPKALPLFRATFSPGTKLLVNEGQQEQHLHSIVGGNPVAHGAVVCSWGHHASLVADSDTTDYRKFGSKRFQMAAKEALFPADGSPPHAYKGRVSVRRPGQAGWEDIPPSKHGYVLATFASQLEAGFTISPQSKPLDGKLRLIHFGDLGGQEAMDVMTKAFQGGKHVEDDRVRYEVIDRLSIEFQEEDARWRRVCIDGKIIRVEKGGWVEVSTDVDSVVDLVCTES